MSFRSIAGTILLIIGGGLLLDRAGVLEFGQLISTWWPLILVVIAGVQIGTGSAPLPGSLILLAVGMVFQAINLDLLPPNTWAYLWPVVLIAVGLWLIAVRGWDRPETVDSADTISSFVAFGGVNPHNESTAFCGGSVTAIFGGAEVDLRSAQLAPEGAKLDLTAAFGGIELFVPSNWRVEMTGLPIFGGWDNKTRLGAEAPAESPALKINCFVAFGGVEVHN